MGVEGEGEACADEEQEAGYEEEYEEEFEAEPVTLVTQKLTSTLALALP